MHMRIPLHVKAMLLLGLMLSLVLFVQAVPASAASAKVSTKTAGVYKTVKSKKPFTRLKRGKVVKIIKNGRKWIKVKTNGKVGYIKKSSLKKLAAKIQAKAKSAIVKLKTLRKGSSGAAVKRLQNRLRDKGYLKASSVNGRYSSATKTAVRQFQMMNSLSVTGTASVATQKKLYSSSARSKANVSCVSWGSSGIDSAFPFRSTATIIDLSTGIRIRIRRLYGSSHCDVEPLAKSDTARLKRIYGGKWSWNSRSVLLIAGGKCFAAAINSMPHGGQISRSNNYPGQFCLHLNNSKTHGSNKENAAHQANVRKVHNYFH